MGGLVDDGETGRCMNGFLVGLVKRVTASGKTDG